MKKVATAAGATLALVCLSAVALAGAPSTLGDDHLLLQVKASPPRASTAAKPQVVGIEFSLIEFTENGKRSVRDTRSIALKFTGFRFHPEAFPKCLESKLEKSGPSACPAGSKVGTGDALADARPLVPRTIHATAVAFNGTLDLTSDNKPTKGKPAILLYTQAQLNGKTIKTYIPAQFLGGDELLDEVGTAPAPGQRSAYSISAVHLKLPAKHTTVKGKTVGYITAPTSCPRNGWAFVDVNTYWSGEKVTTRDTQPCVK